jgi:hypothetical protein
MKHRGVDFDVEEDPPSFWHSKIYPEAGPMVIGDMRFQTRGAGSTPASLRSISDLIKANGAAAPNSRRYIQDRGRQGGRALGCDAGRSPRFGLG